MKFLFKFILGLLIFVIVTVIVPLVFLYFSIVDKTDDAPVELYTEEVNLNNELTTLFDSSFDLENKDSIDITFTKDSLNKVIFSLIKESNPEFRSDETCTSDSCKYINTAIVEVPVLGTKKVHVRNIYADIVDDKLGLYVTMDLMGVKTKAKMLAKFSETDDNFKIKFESIGLGKADFISGIAGKVILFILEKTKVTEDVINDNFESNNLPFDFNMDDFSINISKDRVNEILYKIIDPEKMTDSGQKQMLSELLVTLTDKDNDLTDFGVFGNTFGIKFDLTKFKVDDSLTNLNNEIINFNKDLFIKNKVQNLIFSKIANEAESKMTFTNLEFNQIIYNQSNGYESFKVSIPLPNTDSTFDFQIIGIILDFNATDVDIRVNVNLNGLITSINLKGIIKQNNSSSVVIQISDEITLGQDISEETKDYINASSDLIIGLLSDNISNMGVMSYSPSLKGFVLSSDSFVKLMTVDGGNVSPLTVNRINIIDNAIEVYAYAHPDDSYFSDLDTAKDIIKDVLSTNSFTTDDFDTTDSSQTDAVNNLLTTLDTITESITNNNLSVNDTDKLIENLNQLSIDNQQKFLEKINENANSSELEALYNSLFGN